nr:hypothetical protein CFP56_13306 [Quercus suber]
MLPLLRQGMVTLSDEAIVARNPALRRTRDRPTGEDAGQGERVGRLRQRDCMPGAKANKQIVLGSDGRETLHAGATMSPLVEVNAGCTCLAAGGRRVDGHAKDGLVSEAVLQVGSTSDLKVR